MLEIRGVIGTEMDDAIGKENAPDKFGEVFVDEPVAAVFVFRPRVGEINVYGIKGVIGQEVLEEIPRFKTEEVEIGEFSASAFFIEFAYAAEQTLDADEIFFRMSRGPFQKKPAITTANFQFGGMGHGKEFLQPQRFGHGFKLMQQAHFVSVPTKRAREAV